ncbi:unnamed protein product [Moneuplotes crassus]|uniref:Uncharacterized protein n=1 Tax=Euplotes crassus TaxID=5936 RepID=A0AAD1XEX3_EUPCR|nr:unnamed protein product [Moneuplotes crassus]
MPKISHEKGRNKDGKKVARIVPIDSVITTNLIDNSLIIKKCSTFLEERSQESKRIMTKDFRTVRRIGKIDKINERARRVLTKCERSIKRFDTTMQKAKVIEKATPQEFSRKICKINIARALRKKNLMYNSFDS